MRLAVLGAGIVGVTTAWYLSAAGHEVTLIDRQPGPGLETSYANGAQLSAGHAEPWAQPGAILKLLRWLPREDAPLLFRLRLDPAQWLWGLHFLAECRPERFRDNLRQILALGVYSRSRLRELRAAIGMHYDELSLGILNIHEDAGDYAHAVAITRMVRELGYERHPVSVDEAIALEPALAHRRDRMVGATWTPPDETGDALSFCQALAAACTAAGVQSRFDTSVVRLELRDGALRGVVLSSRNAGADVSAGADRAGNRESLLELDGCVVALASYSAALLRPLGIRLPIYPAKGYSATLPLRDPGQAPRASVTDEASKMVFTRLGNRLRIAGTAEFNGYNLELNPVRCAALTERGRTLFPHAADYAQPVYWTGLRPATPSNRPLIGETRVRGLFLNAGHGTLGWTEACGSAHALSLLVDGRRPELDFDFLNRPAA